MPNRHWKCRKCKYTWATPDSQDECPECHSLLVDEDHGITHKYTWKCLDCGSVTEISRKMNRYNLPPETCQGCGGSNWKRIIEKAPMAMMDEDHKSPFPLTIKKLKKKVLVDKNGRLIRNTPVRQDLGDGHSVTGYAPTMVYEDVTFRSKAHQDRWMKDNGYVRTLDGHDTGIGNPSQHSTFDQRVPPPSDRAVEMLKQTRFVEKGDAMRLTGETK